MTLKIALFSENYTADNPDLFSRIKEGAEDAEFQLVSFQECRSEDIISLEGYKDLITFLYDRNFDYVYFFNSYGLKLFLPLLGKFCGFQVIYAPHCMGFHKLQSRLKNFLKKTLVLPFMSNSYVRCLSRWEQNKYANSWFIDSKNVFYAPYGIDYAEFSKIEPSWESKEIFSLSNAREFKDIETQIEAIACLKDQYPKVHLNIIGGWENEKYRKKNKAKIKNMGLEENITIHGFVEKDKMFDIISGCEAFIHTSKFETQGLAIYEAAAAGFPICASDVPVHNQNFGRFKHPQGDYEALAEDIKAVFEMEGADKQEISNEMRSIGKKFSVEEELRRLERINRL